MFAIIMVGIVVTLFFVERFFSVKFDKKKSVHNSSTIRVSSPRRK